MSEEFILYSLLTGFLIGFGGMFGAYIFFKVEENFAIQNNKSRKKYTQMR